MSSANDRQVAGTHYQSPIQHWDYVVANEIPYLEAQVIKYLTRWRKKNGMEDVYKAKHYLDKLIEVEESKLKENQDGRYDLSKFGEKDRVRSDQEPTTDGLSNEQCGS